MIVLVVVVAEVANRQANVVNVQGKSFIIPIILLCEFSFVRSEFIREMFAICRCDDLRKMVEYVTNETGLNEFIHQRNA